MKTPQTPPPLQSLLKHEPFVRAILRRMMVGEDMVADLTQDTWVRALQNPPAEDRPVRAWLATVARNLARDSRRAQQNVQHKESQSAKDRSTNHAIDPVTETQERTELLGRVVAGVSELAEPYKSVVLLRYFDGLTPAKIAERLQSKPATVRTQLHRAHGMLKVKLDGEYDGGRKSWLLIAMPIVGSGKLGVASGSGLLLSGPWLAVAAACLMLGLWIGLHFLSGSGSGGQSDSLANLQPGVISAPEPTIHELALAEPNPRQQVPSEPETVLPSSQQSIRLRIQVMGASNALAGASAWAFTPNMVPSEPIEQQIWRYIWPSRVFEMVKTEGLHQTLDKSGRATFELSQGKGYLVVQGQGRFCIRKIEDLARETSADGLPVRVATLVDRALNVTVQSKETGKAVANYPVLFELGYSMQQAPGVTGQIEMDRRRTGPDGRVAFRGFDGPLPRSKGQVQELLLRPAVIGSEVAPVVINVAEWTGKTLPTITLESITTGSMEVTLQDANGQPLTGTGMLTLKRMDEVVSQRSLHGNAKYAHGKATFTHVALHGEYQLSLLSTRPSAQWTWKGQGPTQPGQTAQVVMRAPGGPRIVGNFVDESGAAVSTDGLPLRMEWLDPKKHVELEVMLVPDKNGEFDLEVSQSLPEGLQVEILADWARQGTERRFRASLGTVPKTKEGTLDLGTVTLSSEAFPLRGICLDDEGQPLEGVKLRCAMDRFDMHASAVSDSDGRFALYGPWAKNSEILLEQEQPWSLADPVHVTRESEDLRIVLQAVGTLSGSIQSSLGPWLTYLRVAVAPSSESMPQVREVWPPISVDRKSGDFHVSGLGAGSYRVGLYLGALKITEANGVQVRPGQTTQAPRLRAWDIRDLVEDVLFECRDQDGKWISGGWLVGLHQGQEVARIVIHDGRALWKKVRATEMEWLVVGDGFVPKTVDSVTSHGLQSIAVELQACPTVTCRVVLPAHNPPLGPSKRLSLAFVDVPAGSPDALYPPIELPVDLKNGIPIGLSVPHPGSYRLMVSKGIETSHGHWVYLTATPAGTPTQQVILNFDSDDAEKVFELELPASLWESNEDR